MSADQWSSDAKDLKTESEKCKNRNFDKTFSSKEPIFRQCSVPPGLLTYLMLAMDDSVD